ncbi:FAD/NAD(P)-binding domain-containing protein [Fimicolochytrium jonesii]|uniref:FAD/NAD(P)-binding domain-containing protein n=1 Tax=Fimicolochytrium jonesii TaxID=1396493 RepID=UPI0022FF3787|nr:FAD/NAD(P)-binding domain-containing protein [Fimicolochytrium jonesii]KAI8817293.1 FAD/NAD(P)-binding domain-containing protein [Fimicolochytrium jonesii]
MTLTPSSSLIQAWCDAIDLDRKELTCMPALPDMQPFKLRYDKLVIAVGAYSNTFGIPGVEQHGFFLKEISHAQKIRAKIIECFEMASEPNTPDDVKWRLLSFAVVGGGPTGVEFSAELHDFIKDDLSRLYPTLMDKVTLTVYDVGSKILSTFDASLADYAARKFAREGIKIRTKTYIKRVEKNKLILADGSEEPFGVLVWSTGLTATPLIRELGAARSRDNRLVVDEYLRVLRRVHDSGAAAEAPHADTPAAATTTKDKPAPISDSPAASTSKDKPATIAAKDAPSPPTASRDVYTPIPSVYALGDCASLLHLSLPATAQVASQQGTYLRKHLNKLPTLPAPTSPTYTSSFSALPKFEYSHMGSMVYVGGWKAIMDATSSPTDTHPATTGEKGTQAPSRLPRALRGRLAWFVWRSAYLVKSVSLRNMVLIPASWLFSFLFGRDTSRF